jgi:peptidoglycan/xylan/chitin deacetylase (PgdA/CDA1 family)
VIARASKTERLARLGAATGIVSLLRRLGTWSGVLGLAYHRVGFSAEPYDSGVLDATPPQFEEQVRHLAREFDVIRPEELDEARHRGRGRYLLITFDDAYHDNLRHALPILKRYGAPATFFITTDFVDSRRISWWDEIAWMVRTSQRSELQADGWLPRSVSLKSQPEEAIRRLIGAYKNLPSATRPAFLEFLAEGTDSGRHPDDIGDLYMTWDEIRELRAAGVTIGGHTVHHSILAQLSADEREEEVAGCRARIETELEQPMRYFSYPDGGRVSFNDETRRCLAEYGVEYAFSFYGGYRTFNDWDPYDIRRRALGLTVTHDRFAMMLALPQIFVRE